jgi:hypothetical protein
MNFSLACPVFFVLMIIVVSSSGAPQSSGTFQFIKKDGKIINDFGDVPSTKKFKTSMK